MSRDGKSQQKRPGRGQMSRESVEASAGTGLSWWGRRAGFGFFQGEGKERFLGEEGFFLHDTPPSGSNPCCSWMNRYSEHMIQEQMFSSSLFEMAKIRIDSEPKHNDYHWLRVELVGIQSNRYGIGARLFATAGDLRQMREILGGLGYYQDELVAHFGLGPRTQVDQLEIRWPSGQVDVLRDIPSDQKIRVFEGREAYYRVLPTFWESAPPGSLVVKSPAHLNLAVRPSLFETGSEITQVTADLSALGGPAEVALIFAEDGTYRVESSFEVPDPPRLGQVAVRIEQATSLGPYWTELSRRTTVLPAQDLGIFTDRGAENWALSTETAIIPINLTNHPAADGACPSFSPDGRHIAFASNRDGNFEIYAMAADGANPVRLTEHLALDVEPAWSPDGTRIVFRSDRTGNAEVYVIDVGETNPVESNPDQQAIVYQGQTALELTAAGLWNVSYVPQAPLNTVGYEILHFAFHPGDVPPSVGDVLYVSMGQSLNLLGGEVEGIGVDLARKEWQVVNIPLGLFDLGEPIEAIGFSGTFSGTFYLDDIRLIAAEPPEMTAVLEAHIDETPQSFTLDQNYPNPFNSGTVIRFSLPIRDDITLSFYNLTGQKVATLIEAPREAGTYTLRWDGRGDDGRELASGVYLYRLQAGTQVETRKLVLVR